MRAVLEADSEATLNSLRIKSRPAQAFNLVVNTAFALVMATGLSLVSGHRLDVVAYLAIMAVTSRMLMPLTRAALFSTEADGARVALTAMSSILDAEPLPEPAPEERARPEGTTIALESVSFSYDEGRPVLKDVSLTAPQGRVTALVGPSGAGKSTILRLAARFWDVGSGAVTIGGADVRALHQELIGVRRRLPWLHDAEVEALHLDNTVLSLRMRARSSESAEAVLVLSLEDSEVWLPTAGRSHVLASTHDAPPPRPERDGVVLPPLGWAVLT